MPKSVGFFLAGVALAILGLAALHGLPNAQAQADFAGQYQVVASTAGNGAIAWRLNTSTGVMDACFMSVGGAKPSCTLAPAQADHH